MIALPVISTQSYVYLLPRNLPLHSCMHKQGFTGNAYSSGPDKCRDDQQLYLEELFGLNKCYGCRYEPAVYGTYDSVNISKVLDMGVGGCGVVRKYIDHGLQPKVRTVIAVVRVKCV